MKKNLLFLGQIPEILREFIQNKGFHTWVKTDPLDLVFLTENKIDYIISFRYRHLITKAVIDHLPQRIINLHISLLPWNRGADPNLWSFLEGTPKGITIHYVDPGLDTGDIILQQQVEFHSDETLATTYDILNQKIVKLLMDNWDDIFHQRTTPIRQNPDEGTFHSSKDRNKILHFISENGWDTKISALIGKLRQ